MRNLDRRTCGLVAGNYNRQQRERGDEMTCFRSARLKRMAVSVAVQKAIRGHWTPSERSCAGARSKRPSQGAAKSNEAAGMVITIRVPGGV